MRMNISVPDALAEEVRRRDVPISAVCQRALREEVDRLRAIEGADDILVYVESEQADPDPASWPEFDPAKPVLTYKRLPLGGRPQLGWVLDFELGDEPGDNPTDTFTGGDPGDPPIEWARHVVRAGRERHARELEEPYEARAEKALADTITSLRGLLHRLERGEHLSPEEIFGCDEVAGEDEAETGDDPSQ
jgi:Post-segregation antitoxin CcdA